MNVIRSHIISVEKFFSKYNCSSLLLYSGLFITAVAILVFIGWRMTKKESPDPRDDCFEGEHNAAIEVFLQAN